MRKTVTVKNGQMYLLLKSCLTLIVDYVAFVSLWKKWEKQSILLSFFGLMFSSGVYMKVLG